MEINLTADEREMLYNLQTMRWSSFQGKPLSKIDGEYQKMVADDLKQMMKSPPPCGDITPMEVVSNSRAEPPIHWRMKPLEYFGPCFYPVSRGVHGYAFIQPGTGSSSPGAVYGCYSFRQGSADGTPCWQAWPGNGSP